MEIGKIGMRRGGRFGGGGWYGSFGGGRRFGGLGSGSICGFWFVRIVVFFLFVIVGGFGVWGLFWCVGGLEVREVFYF